MVRTFKDFVVVAGGTPQPLVSTVTSAASKVGDTSLPVSDSSQLQVGDSVIVDAGANAERVMVMALPDSTHITTKPLEIAHASGVKVRLAIAFNTIFIQTKDGNTGTLYVGNSSSMVKATGVGVIAEVVQVAANAQPNSFTLALGPANTGSSGEFWIDGTTNDTYRVTLGII